MILPARESSGRLIVTLTVLNVIGMEIGRLSPAPPSPIATAVGLLLVAILIGGAVAAGRRVRPHWLRDGVRDVVAGQALGWTIGLALVGVLHGGLSSPRSLAGFAPVFLLACALVTLLIAPIANRFAARTARPAS